MRFQRQAKIFRGQLDPAPIAGVFFLLLIFVLLSSLLYTPGVLVELKDGEEATGALITITRQGEVVFAGKTYQSLPEFRTALKSSRATEPLQLRVEPGADLALRDAVRDLLLVDPPALSSASPEGIGTDAPVVIVAVNLRGQFFYENQVVQEDELGKLLTQRRKSLSQDSTNLTLVVLPDNEVTMETLVRLRTVAVEAGIRNVIMGTRSPPFSSRRESRKP